MTDAQAEALARAADPEMWRYYDLCFKDDPAGWRKFREERLAQARLTNLPT